MIRKSLIIIIILIIITSKIWVDNIKIKVDDNAPFGKYSSISSYANISAMKHDIFKQFTLDIVPFLLFNSIMSDEFFNVNNFENSVIGKTLLSALSYALYYQVIQPYVINRIISF